MNESYGVAIHLSYPALEALNCFISTSSRAKTLRILGRFGTSKEDRRQLLRVLLDTRILTVEPEEAERSFLAKWPFGKSTAAHHFAVERTKYVSRIEEARRLRASIDRAAFPSALPGENDFNTRTANSNPRVDALLSAFGRRRSARRYTDTCISLNSLETSMYSGLGITGYLQLPGRPIFPLRYTPSPGGLAAVGGYVIARRVDGLPAGCYQYASKSGNFIQVSSYPEECIAQAFGGQEWASAAAAIIVLVAELETISWKYRDAGAYNAMMIEAGHIGQNIAVTASQFDLSSVFTNAISQNDVCDYLRLDWPSFLPIYAIAIGSSVGIADPADDFEQAEVEALEAPAASIHPQEVRLPE
ncbi:nitroreductase family protein [Pinirhizobacter soli]|uniref:nitroreductase family protein n=1 Tax=Pinirhizobacter soli TaxID=2786953 RepID=UPI00202A73F2|nr:nitroreductase family protein [Pinirhizobacter soli]